MPDRHRAWHCRVGPPRSPRPRSQSSRIFFSTRMARACDGIATISWQSFEASDKSNISGPRNHHADCQRLAARATGAHHECALARQLQRRLQQRRQHPIHRELAGAAQRRPRPGRRHPGQRSRNHHRWRRRRQHSPARGYLHRHLKRPWTRRQALNLRATIGTGYTPSRATA